MTIYQKIGIIVYMFLIIQGVVTGTALYLKAKHTPVLFSLMACHSAMIAWLVFATIEIFSVGTKGFMFSVRLSLLPVMLIGSLWIVFVLYYSDKINQNNRKIVWVILLIPIILYLPVLTKKYQYLIIGTLIPDTKVISWGPLFYINIALSYFYIIFGSIIVVREALKRKSMLWQNILLVISVASPMVFNILASTGIIRTVGFDIVPITFSMLLAVLSLLVFKYKIIDIIPFAYYELFNYINSAALIIDREGNIDDYNKTFIKYFNTLFCPNSCKDIYTFLAILNEYSDEKNVITKLKSILDSNESPVYEANIKISAGGDGEKQFTISIVSLKLTDLKPIGKLIVIKDVTEYRISTISDERKRLSDDLHDSLGNCINNISSNLEYALKHFSNSEEIRECIEISYHKATSAFVHLRRIVEELKPIDLADNGLLGALKKMFYKLRMKGVMIELYHRNVDDKLISGMKHGEVIYFVCQEAVNNAIIHGRAESITITLVQTEQDIKLYITDDGKGCSKIIKNKGLNSMESRIEALGGVFEFGSPSEGGFNLKAVLPLKYNL